MSRSAMTAVEVAEAAVIEWTRRSCEAQGVPVKITDPEVIRQIVILLDPGKACHPSRRANTTRRSDQAGRGG